MKKYFIIYLFISTGISLYSQGYRQYMTQEYERIMRNEATIKSKADIESSIRGYFSNPKAKKITIPVVFHVLYNEGKSYPDQKQIISQIQALKIHFNGKDVKEKHLADTKERFKDKVADIELDFCLSSYDPSGKKSEGINYVKVSSNYNNVGNNMKSKSKGGVDPWNTDRYLNIWVVDLPNRMAGYAQMPGGDRGTDGIVIDYSYLGTTGKAIEPYRGGKTLTHLIGNYLGLYDIWGSIFR